MFNLKFYAISQVNMEMSEDGIPDDSQPDKEFDYLCRFIERATWEDMIFWLKDMTFYDYVCKRWKWSWETPFDEKFICEMAIEYCSC